MREAVISAFKWQVISGTNFSKAFLISAGLLLLKNEEL